MGGVNIPLPELDVTRPAQNPAPNPLQDFARAAELKTQAQTQQLQGLQIQQQTQAMKDQQAITAALKGTDPTSQDYANNPQKFYGDLSKSVLQNGGSANAAFAIQQHGLGIQKQVSDIAASDAATGQKNLDLFIGKHKAVGDALQGIENTPPDQLHDAAMQTVTDLAKNNVLDPATAQQLAQGIQSVPDPQQLKNHLDIAAKTALGAQAVAEQQKTASDTAAQNAKAALDNSEAGLKQIQLNLAKNATPGSFDKQIDGIYPPNDPKSMGQNALLKGQINAALSRGDVDSAKKFVDSALENVQAVNKEIAVNTNPDIQKGKVAVAAAEGAARLQQQASLLNPAAAQMAANLYTQTGQLPSGMRSPAMSGAILNQAAAAPGGAPDIAQNKMNYGAETALQKSAIAGPIGQQMTSYNTAIAHAQQLQQAADALQNDDTRVLNKIGNQLGYQFGSDKTTNFNVIKNALSGEVSKVFKGGEATDAEIKAVQAPFDAANSPGQLKGAIDNAIHLMNSKRDALQQQYQQGMQGRPNFGGQSQSTSPSPKVLSMSAIERAAKDHNVSVDEARRQAQAAGYTIQ